MPFLPHIRLFRIMNPLDENNPGQEAARNIVMHSLEQILRSLQCSSDPNVRSVAVEISGKLALMMRDSSRKKQAAR